jgi:hypothetical protein
MHKNSKNKSKGFEITQERIDVMKKAAKYLKQIDDFNGWVGDNFTGNNVMPCYYIMEDFGLQI